MGKIEDFLAGRQILETVQSPFNGKLTAVKELAWGTHITAGGITQSGGIAQDIWRTVFKRFGQREFKNVLIVGLGGGGIAKLVSKNWPNSKMVGVEIDPIIVDLGKKYLGLNKINIEIHIEDGYSFCKSLLKQKKKFDLICIDTYVGQEFPKKFESEEFSLLVSKLLDKSGVAIFNRLYYMEKINLAHEFQKKLEKVFNNVESVKPEANIMFLCRND